VGKAKISNFNGPSSVAYWRPDPERYKNASNGQVYIVKN